MDGEDELVSGYGVVLVHASHHLEPAKLSAKSSETKIQSYLLVFISVTYQEDREYTSAPDPDPSDPLVFGPPGSGSVIICMVRIWILPSISKKIEKNFDFNCFVTS